MSSTTRVTIQAVGGFMSITFSNRLNVDNRIYASTNLLNWIGTQLGIETAPGFGSQLQVTPSGKIGFYRMSQIQYPPTLYTPNNIYGKTISVSFLTGISGSLLLGFDAFGTGSYLYNNAFSGPIFGYTYVQDAYRGRVYNLFAFGFGVLDLHLAYTSSTGGTFKGTIYDASPIPVTGTFTSSP